MGMNDFGKEMVGGEPLKITVENGRSAMWTLGCCDCHLYHLFVITREGDEISFRGYRDQHLTDAHRKIIRNRRKRKS